MTDDRTEEKGGVQRPPLLEVQGLRTWFHTDEGVAKAVDGVTYTVAKGETLGVVGESGCGKSVTALSVMQLVPQPAGRFEGGKILFRGQNLLDRSPEEMREIRGNEIAMIFQEPMSALNPVYTVGNQIMETVMLHQGLDRDAARVHAIEMLTKVGIPSPEKRVDEYPHQLSGGMRQRVMIAIAMACDPALLIADEPTTALDVTTQAQIIDLVRDLQHDFGTAVVWISHDLGVIGQVADDVTVLRDGRTVDQAPILTLFDSPRDDYTRDLLAARPVLDAQGPPEVTGTDELLTVEGLDVRFTVSTPVGRSTVHAVRDVSFTVRRGATLGLVGESGSGKSTVAAALTGLALPDGGTATLDGTDVFGAKGSAARALRRRIGLVFQDPFSSLNPRARVATSIAEPLSVHDLVDGKPARTARVAELLELVGLPTEFAQRYPHELSGGQRQRVSIARALAAEPELLILDEATASLDVSVQARVLELLARLQRELGLSYLFIGHDLAVIRQVSHDVLVMRDGAAVEYRPAAELFAAPEEQYTRELLAAVPPVTPRAAV